MNDKIGSAFCFAAHKKHWRWLRGPMGWREYYLCLKCGREHEDNGNGELAPALSESEAAMLRNRARASQEQPHG